MNKINRKLEYALIGLKHMRAKAPGERTSAKELSTAYGCSFDVMSRVLQVLAQKGVLISEQGAHGGYMIGRDLARLSFQELNEILLGKFAIARCLTSPANGAISDPVAGAAHDMGHVCEMRASCNIVTPVQMLNRKLNDFYRSLSIADLFETRSEKSRLKVKNESEVRS